MNNGTQVKNYIEYSIKNMSHLQTGRTRISPSWYKKSHITMDITLCVNCTNMLGLIDREFMSYMGTRSTLECSLCLNNVDSFESTNG